MESDEHSGWAVASLTISRILTELGLWWRPAKNLQRAEHFAQAKYCETKSSNLWI